MKRRFRRTPALKRCCYCGCREYERRLRPLGPDFARTCFLCTQDPTHPERRVQADLAFEALLDLHLGDVQNVPTALVNLFAGRSSNVAS